MTHHITKVIASMSILTVLGLGLIAYWLIFPLKPVILNTELIEIVDKELERGEPIRLVFDYCSNFSGLAEAQYQMVNGTVITFDLIKTQVDRGCRRVEAATLVVPEYASSGEHKLRLQAWYKTSPINWKYVVFESEMFEVK